MAIVKVPATTANLGPGFDCLGMALQIYNRVELSSAPSNSLEIKIGGPAALPGIATDETNLVYRAASRVFEVAGKDPHRLRLALHLEAPLARGMGSSASAIVGGMAAAQAYLGDPLPPGELLRLMVEMEGHPDNVVPCLLGGLTASVLLDGKVLFEKAQPDSRVKCVLFVPDYQLETSVARAAIPADVPVKDAVFNISRVVHVFNRLQRGDFHSLKAIMDDRIHQPYRIPLIKGYREIEEACYIAGASAVCISGAGPTILCIAEDNKAGAVAKAGELAASEINLNVRTLQVAPDQDGTIVL